MDELAQFKGAPPELLAREENLLRQADVVFCGGRKMREKRFTLNPNSPLLRHRRGHRPFRKSPTKDLAVAAGVAGLKGPILGYFGVIDERIDYELIAKLADARSDWHIVMVGPTAKGDPRRISYNVRTSIGLVAARYDQLPALTKAFSVCMMPFAINAATEYINPTKALEYMAAGQPSFLPPINEVKSNFSSVARVAQHHRRICSWCVREAEAPRQSRFKPV